jgi:hypothetical protein
VVRARGRRLALLAVVSAPAGAVAKPGSETTQAQGWNYNLSIPTGKGGATRANAHGRVSYWPHGDRGGCFKASATGRVAAVTGPSRARLALIGQNCKTGAPESLVVGYSNERSGTVDSSKVLTSVKNVRVELCDEVHLECTRENRAK